MKCHRFLVYFETYLTPIIQFVRNISSILQTWQNDRIWRLFVFWFHQKSFTTICELSWMPTTESILSSRLRSVPPCRLRPPVLSDHICLAHWVVVIYRFYCIWHQDTCNHHDYKDQLMHIISIQLHHSWFSGCDLTIDKSWQVTGCFDSNGSINGLVLNVCRAIGWTNNELGHWPIDLPWDFK